ncbi:leucyl aminopeptidase [Irregularibacter muris]|uniref:Probable cytosol aminopeptidase n=1 Tax=Irregularibacter muris TaxID=1796619 RepID=A0AAE3HG63_9FIRM|nr:leucyl aminopeptidase [Irregularibacter muris]MCR1900040.1 leucyl aminopeptidase [Irregularibacter muris]
MEFYIGTGGDIRVFPIFKGQDCIGEEGELYNVLREKQWFEGNIGEVYCDILNSPKKFILLGLGEKEKITTNSLRTAFFKLGKELMRLKIETLQINIATIGNLDMPRIAQGVVEGLLQSEYSFEKYLREKKKIPTVKNVYLALSQRDDSIIDIIEEIKGLVEGVFLARDLVNEPAMVMTPTKLGNNAKKELEQLGIAVEIYDRREIEELEMKAFLAVTKGSAQEPQFIVMNYKGNPNSEIKLALVGKGLTYDSGGYSIKPSHGMVTMHSDMAGAASVIGAMKAIAKSNLKINVVGIVAACENMISGGAYKPGDIIGSMSGKTIEVLNTDAEGRLTLADALWYAVDVVKANRVIDIATLTGACVVALGSINTGAITNNGLLMKDVQRAGEIAGESIWELPHNEEYKELIKGEFGDLKNIGGREAGTITAGLFLQEFVGDTPWVHLDIAGTSYIEKNAGYLPKAATGVPVKTLYYLAKNLENK